MGEVKAAWCALVGGTGATGARAAPGPWAALVWLPLALAEPAAYVGASVAGWLALASVAGAFAAATVLARWPGRCPGRSSELCAVAQLAATWWLSTLLPGTMATWAWVLLGLAAGAAVRPRWALLAVGATAVLAGASVGSHVGTADRAGAALGAALTVAAAGIGAYAVYRLFDVVAELHRTRAELARRAVAEERQRFSRDLHDLLGHTVSVIVVKAEAVRRLAPRDLDAALVHAADIETLGRHALQEVRQAAAGYRGNGLDDELARARDALQAAGIDVDIDLDPAVAPRASADPVLGWVVREATTNVVRHAAASRCDIRVARSSPGVRVSILDDGVGMPRRHGPDAPDRSDGRGDLTDTDGAPSGLLGMTERVVAAGGTLEVSLGVGGAGVGVTAVVP